MKAEYIISAVLIVLVVISVTQIFQISSLKNEISEKNAISGNAVSISGGIDTAGWTENEKMNYEMHGVIPARVEGSSPSSGSGMVGGC